MKNKKIFLPLLISLCLTGCGNTTLTDTQTETITEAEEKLDEAIDIAASYISEAVEAASEDIEKAQEALSQETLSQEFSSEETSSQESSADKGILTAPSDIALTYTGEKGKNYTFHYNGETFDAKYATDLWVIYDSYKINNESDITIICQALCEEHPIHGRDMESYRTPEDMADEWLQHNIAYALLPEDSEFKAHAKDVDLDPEDQGKTFDEIYKDRTGKELTLDEILKYLGN
jgi:hypothetical protein